MRQFFRETWLKILHLADLLVLIRVPLLMVLAGFVLSAYVAQIRELFDISLERPRWAVAGWFFSAGFSLLVWYSARSLYGFHWPHWQTTTALQLWLGKRMPRLLAAGAPLTLAGAYLQATPPPGQHSNLWCSLAYLALALGVWLFTTYRRALVHRLVSGSERPLGLDEQPQVALYEHWRELPKLTRYVHYAGLLALPMSWFIGLHFPGTIDYFGPLALILGAASFSVWASTWPIYLAARLRFPLLSAMAVWAVLMTAIGLNDNHAVRLTAQQQSDQDPPQGLHYSADRRPSLAEFGQLWWPARRADCRDEVWLVSSEGGGIRAAMWTVLVLSELHRETGGRLWPCTFAASGVSGGSLGLAVFAGAYRDLDMQLDEAAQLRLRTLLEADFLAPVLGSMFGVDAVQRFLPWRMFSDRGEALENAWLAAYEHHVPVPGMTTDASSLSGPLADTLFALDSARTPLPALLLNSTVVESGLRLVQHPFSTLSRGELADTFPGVVDGADWLPRELPTFSAAHNSARFTLVSPAGTVWRRSGEPADGAARRLGQVVDGGYFENSATTTLQGIIDRLRGTRAGADVAPDRADAVTQALAAGARIRVIHISNDTGVPPFARNQLDTCEPDAGVVTRDGRTGVVNAEVVGTQNDRSDRIHDDPAPPANAPLYGEARAPLIAILATRDARGTYARQALMDQVAALDGQLWHFRLCQGERVLPLGWTLSPESTTEMLRQLASNRNTDPIREAFR